MDGPSLSLLDVLLYFKRKWEQIQYKPAHFGLTFVVVGHRRCRFEEKWQGFIILGHTGGPWPWWDGGEHFY